MCNKRKETSKDPEPTRTVLDGYKKAQCCVDGQKSCIIKDDDYPIILGFQPSQVVSPIWY